MRAEPLTVLAVEDDKGDAEILRRNLDQIPGYDVDFVHVPNVVEAEAALSRVGIDLTFVDYLLGAGTGLDLLRRMRASGDLRPVICLTGHGDEQVATNAFHAGADDYLVKSDVSPDTLRRAIETGTAQYQRRRLEEQNRRLLKELQSTNELLEKNARHFAEMYETAHQFVEDVSHEFRTPLTVIKEFSLILYDGLAGPLATQQREYLAIVLNRIDDLTVLVDDMLDISKLEAGLMGVTRKVCKIPEIIEHIRPILERKAASREIALEIALDEDLPALYCDPQEIGRVIVNLVVNAFKFSEEKGAVRLWARHDPEKHEVLFGVTDNGPGIHPDSVQAIFERFTQIGGSARPSVRGFGLGLNIAKELVHLNLGDIGVESKIGQGSTFSFTIPIADHSRFIHRFLKHLQASSGLSHISLVSAHIEPASSAELVADIDSFIHHCMGRTDLVFHTHPHRWLLVTTSQRPDAGGALRRIEEARGEENRNRPAGPLPAIDLQPYGTWRLSDQRGEFLARFEQEVGPNSATLMSAIETSIAEKGAELCTPPRW